jgi:NADH:ubiquinone reductase (H+-translocating)
MNAMLAETRSDEATAVVEAPHQERKRVIVIGAGFAGIAAARALRHANVDVVLIDRRNHHIFQPLLYQVATAVLSPAEIAAPIRQLEVKQRNLSVLLAEVTGVDVASRTIEASAPGVGVRKIAFDYLVVATGMRPNYFGHDEFARFAPGLKSLSDAESNMAVVGKNYAVLERGWLRTSGFLTWLVWAFVHILALPQLQNRLRVQRQWLWSYFTGQRSSRLIPEPPGIG